jgi:hypothetical protein
MQPSGHTLPATVHFVVNSCEDVMRTYQGGLACTFPMAREKRSQERRPGAAGVCRRRRRNSRNFAELLSRLDSVCGKRK